MKQLNKMHLKYCQIKIGYLAKFKIKANNKSIKSFKNIICVLFEACVCMLTYALLFL